jgi:hypothetical protein
MNISQLFIGFCSGLIVGLAVASHAFSRAMVIGLIAGVVIGGIVADGVDGYLNWAAYIPAEMAKFTAFWIAMIAGGVGGAAVAWSARASRSAEGGLTANGR